MGLSDHCQEQDSLCFFFAAAPGLESSASSVFLVAVHGLERSALQDIDAAPLRRPGVRILTRLAFLFPARTAWLGEPCFVGHFFVEPTLFAGESIRGNGPARAPCRRWMSHP